MVSDVETAGPARPVRSTRPILIAGGGIGGVAAALALADCGYRCRILERRTAFSEAGAGIQIGPNGVRALRALGVDQELKPKVGKPAEIVIYDGKRGRPLTVLPLGSDIEARLGAPYWTAHRADLHAALLQRAQRHDLIAISLGFAAGRLEAIPDGIRVLPTEGAALTGAALIGADGLWSKVRGYVADHSALRFAGRRAYRAVIPAHAAPNALQGNATGLWLARGAHVVHYPVRCGAEIALVVIVSGNSGPAHEWGQDTEPAVVQAAVEGLMPAVMPLIASCPSWKSWALYDLPPLARWSNGRVALLGDAAHPVLPFLAQGGVLALEDALTLAQCVADGGNDITAAFAAYGKARIKRTRHVAAVSRRNGTIYHLGGAAAVARNMVLRASPAPRLLGQYDWIYGWQPPGVVTSAPKPAK